MNNSSDSIIALYTMFIQKYKSKVAEKVFKSYTDKRLFLIQNTVVYVSGFARFSFFNYRRFVKTLRLRFRFSDLIANFFVSNLNALYDRHSGMSVWNRNVYNRKRYGHKVSYFCALQ
jgi:hypothetical protein